MINNELLQKILTSLKTSPKKWQLECSDFGFVRALNTEANIVIEAFDHAVNCTTNLNGIDISGTVARQINAQVQTLGYEQTLKEFHETINLDKL